MTRRSARLSLGGSALQDISSRHNERSSSVPRRMSLGGSSLPLPGESVKKDRRTLLEEWRQQVREREKPPTSVSSNYPKTQDVENKPPESKRSRSEFESISSTINARNTASNTPLVLPPSGSQRNPSSEGATALERFRMRRQQQKNQEETHNMTLPPQPPPSSTVPFRPKLCFDDDDDENITFSNGTTGTTPRFSKRLSISGAARRRQSRSSSRKALTQTFQSVDSSDQNAQGAIEQHSMDIDVNSFEGANMRSKLDLMAKRIKELEKEKMALSMSKAPLEARFRQKEDQWSKERKKMEQEILSLRSSCNETNEQLKNVEMQLEDMKEENTSLRLEARKAASSVYAKDQGVSDAWSRQLQNDRDVAELKEKLRNEEEEVRSLRLEKVSIESEVNATSMELTALMRDFDDLKSEYDLLLSQKESNSDAEIQLQELSKEHTATTAQLNAACMDLATQKSQAKFEIEQKEREWKEEKDKLLFEASVLKNRAGAIEQENNLDITVNIDDKDVLKAKLEEKDRRIVELEARLLTLEQQRRTMHNRIQELRGNIRVFVRTRPFLPCDGNNVVSCIDVLPDEESLTVFDGNSSNTLDFKFDKIFPPSAGQDVVFEEVSEFVQSALDGYNVCLFSYGQTGSGKTHTMQGSGSAAMRGIIPRAVEQILTQAKLMQKQNWTFSIRASFLEIYNEGLRDLLMTMNNNNGGARNTRSKSTKEAKLAIKMDSNGKRYVDGLTRVNITTEDSAEGMEKLKVLMSAAARARSVATTKMNAQSSRSHSVFMLHLCGRNEENGVSVEGELNLCDLAGSERLNRSGAGSDIKRLKETQAINKSLSCLGDVFNALANGASHIPFRNSKLTYLLQDCLSGDGKALMFVNLSPTHESSHESLCSLRFAQRVNQVELGKATKHVQYAGRSSHRR